MDRVYRSRDHDWLRGSGGRRDSSERERVRERRTSEFSPMAPLGGGAAETVT
jgi:hypothetical protein